jgi:hypothetical protein
MKSGVVEIRLWGGLHAYTNGQSRLQLHLEEPIPVRNVLFLIGVPISSVAVISIDSKVNNLDACVENGNTLDIFARIGGG